MKIIFLDIDGVLNSQLFFAKRTQANGQSKQDYYLSNIDSTAVSHINALIEETGAKIVISSTWRIGNTITYLQSLMHRKGFTGEIIGATPVHRHIASLRGNEIYQWMSDNKELLGIENVSDFKEYVIFDDGSDMLYWQRNNYIQVDAYCGLEAAQCNRAKVILCPEMALSEWL